MAEKTYYSNVLTSFWFWRQHCSTGELRPGCWDWRHWRHVVILLHSTVLTLHTIIREPGSWSWHVRHVTMGDQGAGSCPRCAHVCKCSTRTWQQNMKCQQQQWFTFTFSSSKLFFCVTEPSTSIVNMMWYFESQHQDHNTVNNITNIILHNHSLEKMI